MAGLPTLHNTLAVVRSIKSAKTFTYLSKGQTGDAGAVFRDPAQSKDLRKRLKDAEASAEKSCFVK